MSVLQDSTRLPRVAAWIWLGFLAAMLVMDIFLFSTNDQNTQGSNAPVVNNPQLNPCNPPNQRNPINPINPLNQNNQQTQGIHRLYPVMLYYASNFAFAFVFLAFTHWGKIQDLLGKTYYPFLLIMIGIAPILINVLVVPRFPPGPLSNAEGMALRQLPVMFVALALIAREYGMAQIILYSIATSALELVLIFSNAFQTQSQTVFVFIAIIRAISFIALGLFINLLVKQLRAQGESLREANANLAHYASTLEQLAVSRERNRLARELHDTLAHSLTALAVSLETAKAYFDIDRDKSRELLDSSLEATRHGADETRRALKSLRSSALDDMGLELAIRRAAESAAARFDLNLELDLKNPTHSLSPEVEQTIYRIAQEAIENVATHSKAKNLRVHLSHNSHTTLIVQDDGIGFDTKSKSPSGHFGLVGMRERAQLAGGQLTIESQKDKGTKITLEI